MTRPPRAVPRSWQRFTTGPHAGKTAPQVLFSDPDYLFDAVEHGQADGPVLADVREVYRLAQRIRFPRDPDDEHEVAVLYHLLPDGRFGGLVIVRKSDPRMTEYQRVSVARSDGFDLTMPRRIAPGDLTATREMLAAVLFQLFGDPHARLTGTDCAAFFEARENFLGAGPMLFDPECRCE